MTTCTNCGRSLPDDASFCPDCGTSLQIECGHCGETVPTDANFCPSCRERLDDPSETSSAGGSFRLSDQEFARRLEGDALKSDSRLARLFGKKEISIEAGNRALFFKDGQLVDDLKPGKHTVDSLSQQVRDLFTERNLTVVLLQDAETTVRVTVDGLRTAEEYPVTATVELSLTVADNEAFFRQLMANRTTLSVSDFNTLLGDVIRDELQATVVEYERDELYGNRDLKQDIRDDIETYCQTTLERNGLELVELRSFEYEDDRDHIREGRKEVEIREDEEEIKDDESQLDRRSRERETDDEIHAEKEDTRKRVATESAEMSGDHELEKQEMEQDHEKVQKELDHREAKADRAQDVVEEEHELEDKKRRHEHKAERETVEHEEATKTTRKEGEVNRRDLEHEQDVSEMEDLTDLKKKKDMDSLDVDEREQEMEMQRDEHEVELEKERLQARDDVDIDTVASLEDADSDVADLAEMEKAENLSPEQLDALGAQESDELAKARQEANSAKHERKRVEDQKEFRDEIKEMAEDSMDRMQETTDTAMDNMGETGKAAAEDTSDNVIVSDSGSSDDGDTTIVQGGGGSGGDSQRPPQDNTNRESACPNCGSDVAPDDDFCLQCGVDL